MDVFERLEKAFAEYKAAEEQALAVSRLCGIHDALQLSYQRYIDRFSYAYRITSEWYAGEQMPLEYLVAFLMAVDHAIAIEVE